MLLVVAALMFWRSYRLRSDRREVTAMRRLAATGFATLAVALALDLPLVAIIGLFDLALGFGSLALGAHVHRNVPNGSSSTRSVS
jgi:C4-dicarboxylate-specific signal transduction histidine kinase